ncbi:MAG: topoisomerase [Rhodospirillales bacterium]|nr:topoisomerase [Rhodospirillales bacterium]
MIEADPIGAVADLPTMDPLAAAEAAELTYVSDRIPGITREKAGDNVLYRASDGTIVADDDRLSRIAALRIPPVWTDVWICPDPHGHIQATGFDTRARKQYLYHPAWRAIRDQTKFAHMMVFGQALPHIRRRVAADIDRPGLPREKVLAAVVRLMERTLGRVGNPEYAEQNEHFGLSTLRHDHVRIEGDAIELDFRGKAGVHHHKLIADPTLARILELCQEIPGSVLFQYLDEAGHSHRIASGHVNGYLKDAAGHRVTAKDFRTWAATNLAVLELANLAESRPSRRGLATAVKHVAAQLGNTPMVCRKSYIHPRVLADYLAGTLRPSLRMFATSERGPEFYAVEGVVLRLLAEWEAALDVPAAGGPVHR